MIKSLNYKKNSNKVHVLDLDFFLIDIIFWANYNLLTCDLAEIEITYWFEVPS